jgi:hypothetical protein
MGPHISRSRAVKGDGGSPHYSYIEFPAEGLLADYKPCILAGIRHYCEKWGVPWWVLSNAASLLAHEALASYDPSKGSFGTHLFHRFKRLNRVAESHLAALHGYRRRPRPTRRMRAREKYADEQGRINWDDHRPVLMDLEQYQRQSLRLTQKAVLDWMIEPDGRTLTDVAEWNGISKSRASRVRWSLLHKAHSAK